MVRPVISHNDLPTVPNFVKGALRNAAARVLAGCGLTSPRRFGRGRLSIATFHRVLPAHERAAYPYPGLAVTPEELDALLGYFTRHFDCGPLAAQHERFMRAGHRARPLLAITFDDGQHDNLVHARPLLARHGVTASFFVPVTAMQRGELLWHDRLGFALLALLALPGGRAELDRLLAAAGLRPPAAAGAGEVVGQAKQLPPDRRRGLVEALETAAGGARAPGFARLMTFEELGQLAADGHEIGSHSMTHAMLDECDEPGVRYELEESRRELRARVGQPVESFCYPNGNFDGRSAHAAARAGYRRAVTTRWGSNGAGADPFLLRRCDMDAFRLRDARGGFFPEMLAFRMSGLYPGLG